MKEGRDGVRQIGPRRLTARADNCLVTVLALCLALGSYLLQGCAVGAAAGLLGATTTAGVLASEAFDGSPNEDEPWSVSAFVENETEVYAGPGEEYSRVGTLKEGVEIQVLGQQGDWIECGCHQVRHGWVHYSSVSGT